MQGKLGLEYFPLEDVQGWPGNPKQHDLEAIGSSIDRWGDVDPLIRDDRTGRLVAGHGRTEYLRQRKAAGHVPPRFVQVEEGTGRWLVPVVVGASWDTDAEAEGFILAHNQTTIAGGWGSLLAPMMQRLEAAAVPIIGWGTAAVREIVDGPKPGGAPGPRTGPPLADTFLAPPFTVLDARQGYWKDRKAQWAAWGIRGEAGREHLATTVVATEWMKRGTDAGGSIFDPVLCEVVLRWFAFPGGAVLDPFAGEATKGLVAAALGYQYTGVELRAEQVQANHAQATELGVKPTWLQGDSAQLDAVLPPGAQYDFIWTSPPYFDLEVYSADKGDGSAFSDFGRFMKWYAAIFAQAVARLRPNRFLAVKIGDVRDNRGGYRNFLGENIATFLQLGLTYYNEAVLVTPIGSLPLRVKRQFTTLRKLGKAHQNVLVFYKGDPRKIKDHFPEVACADVFTADPGDQQ